MKKIAIIVAGGSGNRMKSNIPKQFLLLNGEPILMHTISLFEDIVDDIIVVINSDWANYWLDLCQKYNFKVKHSLVNGGAERFYSVQNAINGINEKDECLIAIHDAVRPFVKLEVIKKCFEVAENNGSAIPVIDIKETIRKVNLNINKTVDRKNYKIVQTPQIFLLSIMKMAYNKEYQNNFTDDAAVVENCGYKINLVDGNAENIKITDEYDLNICKNFKINNF